MLYMRSPDGILFTLDRESEVKKKPPEPPAVATPEEEKSPPLASDETKEEVEEIPAEVQSVKQQAKKVYKNKEGYWEAEFSYGIVMVYIPAGEFTMGSDGKIYNDEKPVHLVTLDGYWIGKYEVTVGQFKEFVKETGYRTEAEKGDGAYVYTKDADWVKKKDANWQNPYFKQGDKHPVVCISWNDAVAYNKWLSEKMGLPFKLPTEAQWEKAARGTDGRKYPWDDSPVSGEKLNFADKNTEFSWSDKSIDDGYKYTAPVGSYLSGASPYGLLDMAGNVWEWCSDWFDEDYYEKSPGKNPTGPDSGSYRVVRGGSWDFSADFVRCAIRDDSDPAYRDISLGFRLCLDNS